MKIKLLWKLVKTIKIKSLWELVKTLTWILSPNQITISTPEDYLVTVPKSALKDSQKWQIEATINTIKLASSHTDLSEEEQAKQITSIVKKKLMEKYNLNELEAISTAIYAIKQKD